MLPLSERRTRGWPLTQRLVVALSLGAFFVALVLGFLGADREDQQMTANRAAAERTLAGSLAERGAPLLDRSDVMRLSVLATVVRDQSGGRVLVLEQSGRVLVDTALVLGERHLGLLAASGAFQRATRRQDGIDIRETLVPIRFGGEVTGEVRLQCEIQPFAAAFDFSWFGLVFLSCLTLVAGAAMLGHHWSSRVRTTTDAMIRLAAGEIGGATAETSDSELQDLGSALRELERGMQVGLQRVGDGFVGMALLVVDGLERRHLIPPGHGERTARLAARLAERLQLLPADRSELELACRLVDLGKAWVRPTILQKQGALSEVESDSLLHHPVRAAEQLEHVPALRRVARILRHQLERYDGTGSPDGLRGDRIPLASRALAVVAAFDLLTCAGDRPMQWEQALQQLQKARGEVFDPWLVDLFSEEVRKEPPTATADRDVMIVPGGGLPWRTPADAEPEETGDLDDGELEVMLDEPNNEDRS